MKYEDFLNSKITEDTLHLINLKITDKVAKWLNDQFNLTLETNHQYPLNGFKLIKDNANLNNSLFSYIFKYGVFTYKLVNTDNYFNFYKLTLNKEILSGSDFKSTDFSIIFNNDFEIQSISNEISQTNLKNGIAICSSIEATNNNTQKIIIYTKNADFLELFFNKNLQFFEFLHVILEKVYKSNIKNETKNTLFNDYPEVEDIPTFKRFLELLDNEYQNDLEGLKMKMEIVSMIYI